MLNYFLHAIGYVGAASLRRGLVLTVPVPGFRPSVRPNDTVTLLSCILPSDYTGATHVQQNAAPMYIVVTCWQLQLSM
jgi:hypothetical protein